MQFTSALDLYQIERKDEMLDTGLKSLNTMLGGGIRPGSFLEIVGLSGAGKSQFCMQLAVNLQKNETKKNCVYVDTEAGFQTKRICDIATSLLTVESTESLKRILVSRCRDLVELMSTIHRLELLVQQNPEIGMIIVDSVAMPLNGENDYAIRSRLEISRVLSKLAASHRLIVVAVNHVRYCFEHERSDEAYLGTALGTTWSHRPSMRFWLCPPDAFFSCNTIFLVKSSYVPNGSVPFKITEGGLVEIEHDDFNSE